MTFKELIEDSIKRGANAQIYPVIDGKCRQNDLLIDSGSYSNETKLMSDGLLENLVRREIFCYHSEPGKSFYEDEIGKNRVWVGSHTIRYEKDKFGNKTGTEYETYIPQFFDVTLPSS